MLLCAPSGPGAWPAQIAPVALRPGRPEDDATCGRIVAAANASSGLSERLPFARAVLEDSAPFACDMGERLVALRGEAVVGFVDFVRSTGSIPYLFVLPGAQGQGVGGTLLEAAEAVFTGPAQITVPEANERALAWYMRRGYREVGRQVQDDWHGGRVVWILLAKLGRLRPG